jgi:nicotinamidase-related amidase
MIGEESDNPAVVEVGDALLAIDLINLFDHDDADALLNSFQQRLAEMEAALTGARNAAIPVVFANDTLGRWDGDAPGLVQHAIAEGRGGDLVSALAPTSDDRFVFKARYSAFDHTPLHLLLKELRVRRLLLLGAATEGCVVQTGIDGREHGYQVTILRGACATNNEELERIALAYAEQVGGIRIAEGLADALAAS